MNLEQAMLLVAQRLPSGAASVDRVRSALLQVLARDRVPGLTEAEEATLREWLDSEFGTAPDRAGALYQAMLGRVIGQAENGDVCVRQERGAHRATGAYYTETPVVRYMLRRARAYMPGLRSVIDPACGHGAFLAGAAAEFPEGLDRLTGLDADQVALELCRRNLPGADLRPADALLDDTPTGYDLCLGNPPYISTGLRGAAAQDRARQNLLKERYPRTAQYKINTYPLFVERGLHMVREGGVLGYILPDSFLSGRYFEGLRRLLLEHTLLELTLICEDFWQHGQVGHSVILFVRKGSPPEGHHVQVKVCRQVADLEYAEPYAVTQPELAWGPVLRFPLIVIQAERELVRAMEAASGGLVLGQLIKSYSGLIGKNGQQSLLRQANAASRRPWGRLLRSGREIDRYRLAWGGEEVCLDPALIKSGGCLSYYQNPKILLRQTADCLRAVYDDQGYYCLNNIHLLVPRTHDVPLRALLGLINSEPLNRFYRAVTMETGRLYPQVDLDLLEALPVPPVAGAAWRKLEGLVARRESAASGEAAQIEAEVNDWVKGVYGLD